MRIVVATIIILASLYSVEAQAGSTGRTYLGSSRYSSPSAYYERSRDQNADYSYSSTSRTSGSIKRQYQYKSTQYSSPPPMSEYNNPVASVNQPGYAPPPPAGQSQYVPPPMEPTYVPQAPIAEMAPQSSFAPPPPPPMAPQSAPMQQQAFNAPLPPPSAEGSRVEPYSTHNVQPDSKKITGDIFSGDGFKASMGLGAGAINQYEGSDDYQWLPIPYIDVSYNDRVFFSTLQGIGVHLYKSDSLQFTTALGYRMGRDGEDTRMGIYGDIDAAMEGSLTAAYFSPVSNGSTLKIYGQFIGDLSSTYDGFLLRTGLGYSMPVGSQLRLTLDGYTTYGSGDYMETYFGVSPLQSLASGYALYTPNSGIKDVGLSATGNWAFNNNWSLLGLFGYKRLLGDAADSPIVEDGSVNMMTFGTAVVYSF